MSAPPEALPGEFEDRLALLETILDKGIGKLLSEVRGKGFILEPFGREPDPTPLMSEEEFLKCNAMNEPIGINDDPEFNFEYGFNPMSFLGNYVKWSHPKSVIERKAYKSCCLDRLQARARHALDQLQTFRSLVKTVNQQGSMVLWGPISSSLSPSDVVIFFQPLVTGSYTIDISVSSDFSELHESKTVEVGHGTPLAPMDTILSNLKAASKYYVRVYLIGDKKVNIENNINTHLVHEKSKMKLSLEDSSEIGGSTSGNGTEDAGNMTEKLDDESPTPRGGLVHTWQEPLAQFCSFWTLPSEESDNSHGVALASTFSDERNSDPDGAYVQGEGKSRQEIMTCNPVSLTCVHADISHSSYFAMEAVRQEPDAPMLTCLVGDPVSAPEGAEAIEEESYKVDLWKLHTKHPTLNDPTSLLRNTSLYFAWNDSRFGSDVDIRAEEVAYKRYTHDVKKHTKKYGSGGKKSNSKAPPPPVLSRPQVSSSLASLTSAFPLHYNESGRATRSLYRNFMLGPFIEVIMLDHRGGYMCKEQAKWLKETVSNSRATWKVIVSGLPTAIEALPGAHEDASCNMTTNRNRSRTSSNLRPFDGTDDDGSNVRVHMPEKELEKDDCDELGRPKNSLSYILFSLHRSFERKKAIAATETETVEDEDGSIMESVAASGAGTEARAESATSLEGRKTPIEGFPAFETIALDGGLLLVSSNPATFGSAPYMCTFDPVETGRPFCAEVNLGSVSSSQGKLSQKTSYLNTRYIHDDKLSGSAGGQLVTLSLTREGALVVRIKNPSGKITATQTFTVAANDLTEDNTD